MVASKAAKLMTACVCPVVGSAALTLSVPQVKEAVHKATAPRQYAKPKTRVRQPVAEVASAAIAPCPTAVPVVFSSLELPIGPAELGPTPLLDRSSVTPIRAPQPPVDSFARRGPETPLPPLLPEPTTWMQMILGFGLIGGVIRTSQSRRRTRMPFSSPMAAPNVVVTFNAIRPESERPFT